VFSAPGTGHNDLRTRGEGLAAEEVPATECAQRRDWDAEQRWCHYTLAGDIHVPGGIQLSQPRYQGRNPSMRTVYAELNAGIAGADRWRTEA
jgi:hypothetical protein